MEVLIISKETIKPSSPTLPHLKTFKVSLLDKMFKSTYVKFITYYIIEHPDVVDHGRIKSALAQTLTHYYPLAGRSEDDTCNIDCSDQGVPFSIAQVNCRLDDLLKDPKIEEFYKFLPSRPYICPDDDLATPQALIGVQLNVFECGNIALSMAMSHYICDATSMVSFMKCWSGFSRFDFDSNPYRVPCPSFPGVEIFPTEDYDDVNPSLYALDKSVLREGKCLLRRFVFNKVSIQALCEKARSEGATTVPTRVEAVSMFIWKKCMDTSARVWGVRQPSMMTVQAELRRRMAPLLSENSIGNLFVKATIRSSNLADDDISGLARSFRTSIKEDVERVLPTLMENKGGGRAELLKYIKKLGEICKDTNLNPYNLTSWCKLGFTDINFGWGKPVWFSLSGMDDIPSVNKNTMMIIDGSETDQNLELWIFLGAREMNELENDQDFLAYASPNPPIFI